MSEQNTPDDELPLLGRAEIDQVSDILHEDVPVPEWGGKVRIRGMSGTQRSFINATFVASKGQSVEVRIEALKTMRERVVAQCLIDAKGNRLYGDKEFSKLGEKNDVVIQRLFDKAQELSGISEGEMEELEGKSAAPESGGSDST